MKLEIDINNPEDQKALTMIANSHAISIEAATAGLVQGAIKDHQDRQHLRAHLSEGEEQAERGEFVTQSIDEMLIEFKADMNVA